MRLLFVALTEESEVINQQLAIESCRDFEIRTVMFCPFGEKLANELLEFNPHVLHFGGHGTIKEVLLKNGESLEYSLLRKIILRRKFGGPSVNLRLINFCLCQSWSGFRSFLSKPFDSTFTIGTEGNILSSTAVAFCEQFYSRLASSQEIRRSFEATMVDEQYRKLGGSRLPKISPRAKIKDDTINGFRYAERALRDYLANSTRSGLVSVIRDMGLPEAWTSIDPVRVDETVDAVICQITSVVGVGLAALCECIESMSVDGAFDRYMKSCGYDSVRVRSEAYGAPHPVVPEASLGTGAPPDLLVR